MKLKTSLTGLLCSTCILTGCQTASVSSSPASLVEQGGLPEAAYMEWQSKDTSFCNVYVKEAAQKEDAYVQVDASLIRTYKTKEQGTYKRVDVPGLKAGSYILKAVPVINGREETDQQVTSQPLNVTAQDRTGFAWVNGTSSGAYSEDGTLRNNAVVLYVSDENKDSVNCDVVTGSKGQTTSCKGLQDILNALKKGYDTRPYDFRLLGNITVPGTCQQGDIVIDGGSHAEAGITFEGIGRDATANGWGVRIKNASNVEVRNIGFMNCRSEEGDDVGLQQGDDHVWVHNCDFFYGEAGSDADQVKGDGSLDTKKSTYITVSYNHFYDNGKCSLLGLSENTTEGLYATYHHNWYDHSDSRNPRCRFYSVHVYNNYYDGNAKYGIGATDGASVFVEGNYFRDVKCPMMISMQGSDVIADWKTLVRDEKNLAVFSNEDGGMIKAYNNRIDSAEPNFKSYVTYQDAQSQQKEFDAYEASFEKETVPDSVRAYKGSSTYNNFDTSSMMYVYTAQSPQEAMERVKKYAGRMQGGDLAWTFDNEAEDASHEINQDLKNALEKYQSSLQSIQQP